MNHPSHAAGAILVFLGLQTVLLCAVHLHGYLVVWRDVEESADHASSPAGPDALRTAVRHPCCRVASAAVDIHCSF